MQNSDLDNCHLVICTLFTLLLPQLDVTIIRYLDSLFLQFSYICVYIILQGIYTHILLKTMYLCIQRYIVLSKICVYIPCKIIYTHIYENWRNNESKYRMIVTSSWGRRRVNRVHMTRWQLSRSEFCISSWLYRYLLSY